jgi:hypothetical protein
MGGFIPSGATAALLAFVFLQLAVPARAGAQSAWLPFTGEASVSLTFQSLNYGGHFDETGAKRESVGEIQSYYGILQLEYGLTDRLALNARLPYITSRYTGSLDEPILVFIRDKYEEYRRTNPAAGASVDTGDYYGTLQDFGFTLRYNLLERGLTVTPVISMIVPSHDYRTIGEASAGQNLLALQTGVNVGRLLDPVAPNAYVHGRYTYSFVQSYRDIPLDRSTAEFEVGYAIAPTVVVRALANWMRTHGGIPFDEALKDLSLFLEHDRLLSSRHWHVGAGATVTLTDAFDLETAVSTFVSGAATRYGIGLNVGLTWRFLGPRVPPSPSRTARAGAFRRDRARGLVSVSGTRSR